MLIINLILVNCLGVMLQITSQSGTNWIGISLTAAISLVGFLFYKWIDNVSEQNKSAIASLTKQLETAVAALEKKDIEHKEALDTVREDVSKIEIKFDSVSYKMLEKLQDMRVIIAQSGFKTDKNE